MKLFKMNAIGNDFLILDIRNNANFNINPDFIKRAANRNFGIGCDQFVTIHHSETHNAFVSFYNMDGSESNACGNATRCVATLLSTSANEAISLDTTGGILTCTVLESGAVTVKMPVPKFDEYLAQKAQAKFINTNWPIIFEKPSMYCEVPNPHYVIFHKVEKYIVDLCGKLAGEDTYIFPKKANINFVDVQSRSEITVFVYERGTGPTLACGTGACASVASGIKLGLLDKKVKVSMMGSETSGESLEISWENEHENITMTGPSSKPLEISIDAVQNYINTQVAE